MTQASLLGWVKAPRKKKVTVYRILKDIPAFMVDEEHVAGPFHAGDLVSAELLPAPVWRVLLKRGAAEEYAFER